MCQRVGLWINHVEIIFQIIQSKHRNETFLIGGNYEISNLELAKQICLILKEIDNKSFNYENLIKFVDDRPGHDFRYSVDNKKLKSSIKWKFRNSFDDNLRKTILWYKQNQNWWN